MRKKLVLVTIVVIIFGVLIYSNNISKQPKKDAVDKESNNKSLVVYFSVPETDDANKKMTAEEENSAIVVDGKVLGNTQYVAQLIAEDTKSDLYRIEPERSYTTNHQELVAQASKEQEENARPKIKTSIKNFEQYETIYVGYPIWWSDMPQILYTFFESYDFNGKTIIPFSTHGGSGLADTVEIIQNKLTSATVETNAFTLSRDDMEQAPQKVQEWLESIEE